MIKNVPLGVQAAATAIAESTTFKNDEELRDAELCDNAASSRHPAPSRGRAAATTVTRRGG